MLLGIQFVCLKTLAQTSYFLNLDKVIIIFSPFDLIHSKWVTRSQRIVFNLLEYRTTRVNEKRNEIECSFFIFTEKPKHFFNFSHCFVWPFSRKCFHNFTMMKPFRKLFFVGFSQTVWIHRIRQPQGAQTSNSRGAHWIDGRWTRLHFWMRWKRQHNGTRAKQILNENLDNHYEKYGRQSRFFQTTI